MRRFILLLLSAAVFPLAASHAWGQAAPPYSSPAPRSAPEVALVDIVKVFENHARFKQQMEAIRAEIQAFEREIAREQESLSRQNEQLAGATSEVQRSQLEAGITRQLADLQVKASLKRNEILSREARVYYETYDEVCREVARLANAHGISLVLRFDSSSIDPQDRGSVLKAVNRPVVFQRNLDLTDMLIAYAKGTAPAPTPLGANSAGPAVPAERSLSTRIPFSGGYGN
jgi:Skp family chaperone for outer membrane proteins